MTSDTQTEGLPRGWNVGKLNEVCLKVQDGTHFSPKNQLSSGKYPYVTAKNVKPLGIDRSKLTYLTEADHRAIYERCDPQKGDVLLVKDGVNCGDAALNTFDEEISLLSSVCMLRPNDAILTGPFLRYFLQSPIGQRWLTTNMTGTAIRRLILRTMRETPLPIAPLNEQRRIVTKIDELFSDLDAGVAALERVKANLKRYRASVLKAAVEGRLTAKWREQHPNIEPASTLLKRILVERRKKWEADQLAKFKAAGKAPPKDWRAKYEEPAALDTTHLPEIPNGWCWASLGQLVSRSEYGTSIKCSYDASGDPVLRIPNIARGAIDLSDLKFSTQPLHLDSESALRSDDLLMCRTNGSINLIGKTAIFRNTPGIPHAFASYLLRFRFVETGSIPAFVHLYADSVCGRLFIEAHAASSAGQHNISLSLMHRMPFPLPPLKEQQKIISEVEDRLSVTDQAEFLLQAARQRSARLRQSILKRAFEGKLVRQDPKDEPAEKLLDRIRLGHQPNEHPAGGRRRVRKAI